MSYIIIKSVQCSQQNYTPGKHSVFLDLAVVNRTRCGRVQYSDGLQAGRPRFDSQQGQDIFLFSIAVRPALGPIQPPI
jgi:hypothetical protein